jgi:hypothetical protein
MMQYGLSFRKTRSYVRETRQKLNMTDDVAWTLELEEHVKRSIDEDRYYSDDFFEIPNKGSKHKKEMNHTSEGFKNDDKEEEISLDGYMYAASAKLYLCPATSTPQKDNDGCILERRNTIMSSDGDSIETGLAVKGTDASITSGNSNLDLTTVASTEGDAHEKTKKVMLKLVRMECEENTVNTAESSLDGGIPCVIYVFHKVHTRRTSFFLRLLRTFSKTLGLRKKIRLTEDDEECYRNTYIEL